MRGVSWGLGPYIGVGLPVAYSLYMGLTIVSCGVDSYMIDSVV